MSDVNKIGNEGMGSQSYTKYPAESAPVTKHGGNTAEQDAVVSEGGHGNKIDTLSEGFGK